MPGIDPASLGPYPILQLAAAIIVLMGVGLAIWRGMRDKATVSDDHVATDRLQYKLDLAEFQGAVFKVLEANRESFFKAMADQDRAVRIDLGELDDRLRDIEVEHAAFRERLDARRPR